MLCRIQERQRQALLPTDEAPYLASKLYLTDYSLCISDCNSDFTLFLPSSADNTS